MMKNYDASKSEQRFRKATTAALLISSWNNRDQNATAAPLSSALSIIQPSTSSPTSISFTGSTTLHSATSTVNQVCRQQLNSQSQLISPFQSLPTDRRPRCETTPAILPPSPKRLKYIEDSIDERIERFKKGTSICMHTVYSCNVFWYILGIMELPITNISKPPKDSRLLRDIDYSFIATLKEKMLKYPSAPGASTVAVLCTDITAIEQFEIKYKNVYW